MYNSDNNFQSLSDQYNSTLSQYKQMYQNYIDSLQSNDSSGNLVTLSDASFWGTSEINTSQVSSVNDCTNLCSANSSCTGATYNTSNQNCYLRQGNGNIIKSKSSEIAIIPQSLQYSYLLHNLNQQLLNINKQMTDLLNQSYSNNQNNSQNYQNQQDILNNNNAILKNEKINIEEIIREQELLNTADQNSQIIVTQEYSKYIVYLLIVILLFALVIKFSFSSEQRGGAMDLKKYPFYLFKKLFYL